MTDAPQPDEGFAQIGGAPLYYQADVPDVLAQADLLHATIPGAQKALIPGVAHVPNMERPDHFNRLVLDFLSACHGKAPWLP